MCDIVYAYGSANEKVKIRRFKPLFFSEKMAGLCIIIIIYAEIFFKKAVVDKIAILNNVCINSIDFCPVRICRS